MPIEVGQFARAVFESLALSYRRTLVQLERLTGQHISAIRIVGGGSQNSLLCQMVADSCCRTVIAGPKEATVLGNAVAQAIATGHLADQAQARAAIAESFSSETYQPQSFVHWDGAFEKFEQLCSGQEAADSVA